MQNISPVVFKTYTFMYDKKIFYSLKLDPLIPYLKKD
jgi:hypothetical protein